MKKIISTFMMFAMMAVAIPMLSTEASAQSDCYRDRNGRLVCSDDRSIYDKHRNLINIGIGTAAGAILGGRRSGYQGRLTPVARVRRLTTLPHLKCRPQHGILVRL